MSLKRKLRRAGYDLINGPARPHKILQIWKKMPFDNSPIKYYNHINHALQSERYELEEYIEKDDALSISYSDTRIFKFNIGVTFLKNLLQSTNLGGLQVELSAIHGKSVSISYNNSKTRLIGEAYLNNFLSDADFLHINENLMKDLNLDRLLLISGIVEAKNLKAEIETKTEVSAEIQAKILEYANANLNIEFKSGSKLVMEADSPNPLPIAVQVHRMLWDNGEFQRLKLISDNRIFF